MKKLTIVNNLAINKSVNEDMTKGCWLTDFYLCTAMDWICSPNSDVNSTVCGVTPVDIPYSKHSRHVKGSC